MRNLASLKKCLFKFEDPIMCDCSEKENEEIGTKMKQWQRNEHETEELILWIEPGELDCTTKPWKTSWMRMAYGIRKKKKVPVQWNGNEGINDEIICTLRTDEVDRTLLWMKTKRKKGNGNENEYEKEMEDRGGVASIF